MRISRIAVLDKLHDKVSEIIQALSNRLTARDNWGPEGNVGQILVSRGPRDVDPPPHFADISAVITPEVLQGIPGIAGTPGPAGPAGADGANGMIPLVIGVGEVFTVPTNRQAVFSEPMEILGELVIDGALTMVD